MIRKAARIVGLFVAAGILQIAGILLIKSGPGTWYWRELVGMLAIAAWWNRIGAFTAAIRELWEGRKEHP